MSRTCGATVLVADPAHKGRDKHMPCDREATKTVEVQVGGSEYTEELEVCDKHYREIEYEEGKQC